MNIQLELLMISSIGFSKKLSCRVDKSDLVGGEKNGRYLKICLNFRSG
jgi:hypothetical protein